MRRKMDFRNLDITQESSFPILGHIYTMNCSHYNSNIIKLLNISFIK